jgi:hypothetical protein
MGIIPVPQFEVGGMTDLHFRNFRLMRPLVLHGAEAGHMRYSLNSSEKEQIRNYAVFGASLKTASFLFSP